MKIIIVDNHSLHTDALKELLSDHEVSFCDYNNAEYATTDADIIILSGSHEHPFYSEAYSKEIELIQHTKIPIIGICLGCQLIAHTYGCGFHRNEEKIEGITPIKYIPNQAHYNVYEGHMYCINELCNDIIGVAASEYGYEIIKHISKPQVGLQFHPEVGEPKNDGALLFTTVLADIIS